ncbi:hypothetical protein [Lebetimonas sp. JH369]|nr:hypothetical protein [Lebetimonas sp. JH369]
MIPSFVIKAISLFNAFIEALLNAFNLIWSFITLLGDVAKS